MQITEAIKEFINKGNVDAILKENNFADREALLIAVETAPQTLTEGSGDPWICIYGLYPECTSRWSCLTGVCRQA